MISNGVSVHDVLMSNGVFKISLTPGSSLFSITVKIPKGLKVYNFITTGYLLPSKRNRNWKK